MGEYFTPITIIANRAKIVQFINPLNRDKLDENIFPALKNILNNKVKKKVIFIHLMGCHMKCENRYPKKFNVFTKSSQSPFGEDADQCINNYDNAILYNDFIVKKIISEVHRLEGLNSVIYFSDHGDEVYDKRNFFGHNESFLPSKQMTSIPFIIWMSPLLREEKETLINQTKKNINQHYFLEDFSHSYFNFLDIKTSYYNPSKSYLEKILRRILN